ncbi:TATA-box-binding protein [Candidatus Pacearchaeota archaeon]|nr:TATA-box-binding protein [Candidatus Pacearchaeota archaeon]
MAAAKKSTTKKDTTLTVQNIVATTSLEEEVSLTKLARTNPNTEYNPDTFPGLVLRIKEPKSAVLVFSSGNLVCTGTKSVSQVKDVVQQVIKQLKKVGVNVKIVPKIKVQNIVASGAMDLDLNLNTLALELENTEYEPEQFPGLVYKLEDPTATFLLFSNGKLVCTGTKSKAQLTDSMEQLNKNVRAALKRIKELEKKRAEEGDNEDDF